MDIRKAYEISGQIDADTLERAKKELNEKDPKQRANDIAYIREWISKQTYMKSKLDDDFILSFLRTAKYSYSRTQELIYNYWVNRTTMDDYFHGRNFDDDSVMMEVADLGMLVKLPYVDPEGRVIAIQRIGLWDPQKHEYADVSKYMFSCFDALCEDPRVQINGLVMVLDMTGLNAAHATATSPARAQKMMKCMQDMYPVRIKGINYFNYPKLFDAIFPIVKSFMKEKVKKRLKFHGSDLKLLHKEIPPSLLPKEYGGKLDSITKINEEWIDYVRSRKNVLLDLQKYGVDVNKLPKTDKDANSQSSAAADSIASSAGLTGTFRKLNVD